MIFQLPYVSMYIDVIYDFDVSIFKKRGYINVLVLGFSLVSQDINHIMVEEEMTFPFFLNNIVDRDDFVE